MYKLTNSKEVAIRNFIYEWMKDQTIYCSNCDSDYVKAPEGCEEIKCCERPDFVTNLTALHRLIYTNKIARESSNNQYGSNKSKDFRQFYALTPRLDRDLNRYCLLTLNEPFLKDDKEAEAFARCFPYFRTCEVI